MAAVKFGVTVISVLAILGATPTEGQTCPRYPKGPHGMDCNFDNGDTCSWTRVPKQTLIFSLRSGGTPSSNTGPSNDHTTGTNSGKYAYIETSRRSNRQAQLKSGVVDKSCSPCKLNFWYHMFGSTIKALNVYIVKVRQNMSSTANWTKSGNQGNKWIEANINLVVNGPYQIVIEALSGSSFTGDIAIDDITFTNCPPVPTPTPPPPCSPKLGPGDCDFEQDSCHCCCWQNQVYGDFNDWERGRGATVSYGTGPRYDHTYGNNTGHYMYVEASTARQGYYSHGKLVSRKVKGVTKPNQCFLTFWYHMFGTAVGNLDAYKRPENQPLYRQTRLFYNHGSRADQWYNATMDLYTTDLPNSNFEISIEASRLGYNSPSSDMAVDDITFSLGCSFADNNICDNAAVCTPINATDRCGSGELKGPVTGDCDFECGPCYWNVTACANFDWIVHEGATNTYGTGPSSDHTFGNKEGHYMYIDAGDYWNTRATGERAILESPNVKGSAKSCTMNFFYHMWGRNIGALLIYMRTDKEFQLLKMIEGNQGNQWQHTNVSTISLTDYRIHIIASYGDGYQGDIAIDDISFTGAGCVFDNRKDNTYCGKDLATGCADGSREGFFNEPRVAGCFASWNGEKSMRDPATPPGHHYLNKKCLNKACGNKFKDGSSVPCNVPADACDTCGGWYVCGSRKPSDITNFVNADVCSTTSYGRFSAAINHCQQPDGCSVPNYKDYGCTHFGVGCSEPLCCGLDCEKKGTCMGGFFPKQTAHTPLNQYKGCSRLTSGDAGGVMCCYDPDFVPPTVAPELCAKCDFDKDTCGFIDEDNDDFDWIRRSGSAGFLSGPSGDHTTGSPGGYYYYVETAAFTLQQGDVAILRTPEYNVTALSCKACLLEFWYHMYGSTTGTLEVYIEQTTDSEAESRHPLFHKQGDQGNEWKIATIFPLNITSPTFHVVFLATYHNRYYGDIAIDDVQLRDCQYPTTEIPTTSVPTCAPGQFQCISDLSCVEPEKLCDTRSDCSDGSDEDSPDPCKTECEDNYCVNSGKCYISKGRQKCRCDSHHYGARCEKTYRTPAPPTVTMPPATTEPPQACDPDTNEKCWCLDSPKYNFYHYCSPCEQTKTNRDTCVCNRLNQCFPTVAFVGQLVSVRGTYPPKPIVEGNVDSQTGGQSGDSSSDTGKYAAIGAAIAVLGLIIVAVLVFFMMKQKYSTKKAVVTGTYNPNMMTEETASGIGNPAYNQDFGTADVAEMFSPAEKTGIEGTAIYSNPFGSD